ncbi:MAG TPA: hypothetical protein VJ385_20685 [Fibrobacteria bacterium]|nr:hypothetical protein [Fibrobacteria bacterium]
MNRSISTLSDATLERFVLGELDARRMEEVLRRSRSDADVRDRIAAIRASDPIILSAYPPADMARAIGKRRSAAAHHRPAAKDRNGVRPGRSRPARKPFSLADWLSARFPSVRLRYALPAFVTLLLGVFLTARVERAGVESPAGEAPAGEAPGGEASGILQGTVPPEIRLKGAESGLAIFRKTRSGSELLPPQASAVPGDTLQVFYHSRKALYGVVFSMDGAGSVTLHYPETDGPAAALQAGGMLPLPHAFRLDKAPRFERFFLVTSPRPFSSEGLLARMRAQSAPGTFPAGTFPAGKVPDTLSGLEEGFRQYTYTINKGEPRRNGARREKGR